MYLCIWKNKQHQQQKATKKTPNQKPKSPNKQNKTNTKKPHHKKLSGFLKYPNRGHGTIWMRYCSKNKQEGFNAEKNVLFLSNNNRFFKQDEGIQSF